jgi:peptidylprolyl isomerase
MLGLLGACTEEVTFSNCPDMAHVRTGVLGDTVVLSSGLRFIEGQPGSGGTAESCRMVAVHYTGSLLDGTQFDSSRDRGQPLSLVPGLGTVILGFEQGVLGMRVGGTRRIIIPPNLAYGAFPPPGIPENATLIFDLELMAVQ